MQPNRFACAAVMLIGAMLVGCAGSGSAPNAQTIADARPVVVLNITSGPEDIKAGSMALLLAGHALDDGRAVILFFNVHGVKLADRNLSPTLASHDRPVRQLLADLIDRGATVLVCPACMTAADMTPADLVPGATTASREALFGPLDDRAIVFSY